MEQNRDYFKEQEEYVANNYMSANGETPTSPGGKTDNYKLFTSQYFIGLGVGFVACYLLFGKGFDIK